MPPFAPELYDVLRWHAYCTHSDCDWEYYGTSKRPQPQGRQILARRNAIRHTRNTRHTVVVKRIEQIMPADRPRRRSPGQYQDNQGNREPKVNIHPLSIDANGSTHVERYP